MADVLVGEAERAVLRSARAEDDGVLRTRAADQAHVAKALFVSLVAECSRRRNRRAVVLSGEIDAGVLAADGRRKIDGVTDAVAGAGIKADELVTFADLDVAQHADSLAAGGVACGCRHCETPVRKAVRCRRGWATQGCRARR